MSAEQGRTLTSPETFGNRVVRRVRQVGPLCAGIDPSPSLLAAWGLPDSASGLRSFGMRCVDILGDVVGAMKPQVAFFERHGSAGFAALEDVLAHARAAGTLVIADAKRGDIQSTLSAYAEAWLGDGSPLRADAVTVTPYMGLGALEPCVAAGRATGRGVVVVTRSSNPEGRGLQTAIMADGGPVEDALLAGIAMLNRAEHAAGGDPAAGAEQAGPCGRSGSWSGSVGAVIGANLEPSAFDLAGLGGPVLVPGIGAQGAAATDLRSRFGACRPGTVLANVSRSLLGVGPAGGALRDAARRMTDELMASLPASRE